MHVWMLQYLYVSEVFVALCDQWRYLHFQIFSHYQTHSSASQIQNLCKKIDAICITQSVKKLQSGKTLKCYNANTQIQILACVFHQVYTAVIHLHANVTSRNT